MALPLLGCDEKANGATPRGSRARGNSSRMATRPSPSGKVVELELNAGPVEKQAEDGRFTVFGYNGQVRGPEIRVKEGDAVRVRVNNRLPDGTTIHWHGVPVPNAMDGVPGVTQESIAPGESFTYEFVA